MKAGARALIVAGLAVIPLAARQPASPLEVASVKPNRSPDARRSFNLAPGRYTFTAYTVKDLIGLSQQRRAFDAREMIGGPDWIDKDRFDVVVQAEKGAALTDPDGFPGPVFAMLRAVLADRFNLVVHNEVRERPVYALMTSRADRRLGAGLTRADSDCADAMRKMVAPAPGQRPPGPPPCSFGGGPGQIHGNAVTLAMFGSMLAGIAGRPVVDRTGVSGHFDIRLEYTPEAGVTSIGPADAPPREAPVRGDAPSLFTALQEQLGLKLEATRAPVDVLVIDSVSQPTAN